jgi:DNA-binding NarL/FixJ family response regulator
MEEESTTQVAGRAQGAPFFDRTLSGLSKAVHLTPRESEIARYVLLGESNKQIARRLGISNYTVRDHVSNLLKKSGVTSRTRLGLVLPAPPVQPSPPATTFQLPGLASR